MIQAGSLRVRTLGPQTGPAIILCHGYGAPGDDLVPLARATDVGPATRWFFPEAPLEVDIGYDEPGRAWWPVDMMRLQMELARGGRMWDPSATPDGMTEARDALVAALRVLIADHGVDPTRTVLGGFSQGAMIATDVVLTAGLGFNNLAILSGSHICRDRWASAMATVGKDLHVLQSHGRSDPILPFGIAEALHHQLVAAGASASFIPFQGAHEIRPAVLEGLGKFARARLHAADVR
jgi:phospholipase/carboxylesterase